MASTIHYGEPTMTDADKLEALVRRAVEKGFVREHIGRVADYVRWLMNGSSETRVQALIFSHDFACSLFGEGQIVSNLAVDYEFREQTLAYLHHLQQAVISDNPIDYMYTAVFGKDQHA